MLIYSENVYFNWKNTLDRSQIDWTGVLRTQDIGKEWVFTQLALFDGRHEHELEQICVKI